MRRPRILVAVLLVAVAACDRETPLGPSRDMLALRIQVMFPEENSPRAVVTAASPRSPAARVVTEVRATAYRVEDGAARTELAQASTPIGSGQRTFALGLDVPRGNACRIVVDAVGTFTEGAEQRSGVAYSGAAELDVPSYGEVTGELQVVVAPFEVRATDVVVRHPPATPCSKFGLSWTPVPGAFHYRVEATGLGAPRSYDVTQPAVEAPYGDYDEATGLLVTVRPLSADGLEGSATDTLTVFAARYPPGDVCWWDGFAGHGLPDVGLQGPALLEVFQGEVVAAGHFQAQGPYGAQDIARWNGEDWESLGDGLQGLKGTYISDIQVYAGELWACGQIDYSGDIALPKCGRWDGVSWTAPAPAWPTGFYPSVFGAFDSRLFAFGDVPSQEASEVVAWDGAVVTGSWPVYGSIRAMLSWNGRLVVGGGTLEIVGIAVGNVCTWDGTSWEPMGAFPPNWDCYALTIHGDALFAGGYDNMATEGFVAKWSGTTWDLVGQSDFAEVSGLTDHNGDLFAVGRFSSIRGGSSGMISRWDGQAWSALGSGLHLGGGTGSVSEALSYGGKLYVVGKFDSPSVGVARWDE